MAPLHAVSRKRVGGGGVLHDLMLAARFCDRVIFLDGGVPADGPPATVLDNALLASVFGLSVERGTCADGTPYLLPWSRPGPILQGDG